MDHLSPRVSVVLPVRNGERYVKAAVESILRQTFEDFELLLLDDGSTDRTPALLEEFSARDRRIRVLAGRHRGLVRTLNAGFEEAQGEFVARMDADDTALPTRLAAQVDALENDSGLGMVGAAVTVVAEDLQYLWTARYPTHDCAIRKALMSGSPFAHPVVTMRKSAFVKAGGYRAQFAHAEDYDLWLRMADVSRLGNLKEPLLCYRIHNQQVSVQNAMQQVISVAAARINATARCLGKPEPLRGERTVTLADLEALRSAYGDLVAEMLTSASTTAATQMVMLGKPDHALSLLTWTRGVIGMGRVSRRTTARASLARAAALYWYGQVLSAMTAALLAALSDPLTTTQLALSAAHAFVFAARIRRSLHTQG